MRFSSRGIRMKVRRNRNKSLRLMVVINSERNLGITLLKKGYKLNKYLPK